MWTLIIISVVSVCIEIILGIKVIWDQMSFAIGLVYGTVTGLSAWKGACEVALSVFLIFYPSEEVIVRTFQRNLANLHLARGINFEFVVGGVQAW